MKINGENEPKGEHLKLRKPKRTFPGFIWNYLARKV
jgi:hypothetical protein